MTDNTETMEVASPDVEVPIIDELIEEYEDLEDKIAENPSIAVEGYNAIMRNTRMDDDAVKIKEKCIYGLAREYANSRMFENVMQLLRDCNDFFNSIPKAKTAKIVRNIIDIVAKSPDSLDVQVALCKDVIEWCKVEKRTFLRQRIESKLAALLLQQKHAQEAMVIVLGLLRELKRLDDKQMLTEVHLLESRINHSLQNIPKAKASLTASRSAANAIYVSPLLQAELDEMSGILHCEEGDNVTGYSYFLEAFEAYDTNKDPRAVKCLKYMCLCKILGGHPGEVPSILSGKHGLKYAGSSNIDLQAMSAVAKSAKLRSLEEFKATVSQFSDVLTSDDLIAHHLEVLYDQMLESNLLKIVNPFSCVEISRVAELINMETDVVERKLSQMILDRSLSGILEQGKGHLVIYDTATEDDSYTRAVEIISNMGVAVAALSSRAKGLSSNKSADSAKENDKDKGENGKPAKVADAKK